MTLKKPIVKGNTLRFSSLVHMGVDKLGSLIEGVRGVANRWEQEHSRIRKMMIKISFMVVWWFIGQMFLEMSSPPMKATMWPTKSVH